MKPLTWSRVLLAFLRLLSIYVAANEMYLIIYAMRDRNSSIENILCRN